MPTTTRYVYVPRGAPHTWEAQIRVTINDPPTVPDGYEYVNLGETYNPQWHVLLLGVSTNGTASATVHYTRSVQDALRYTIQNTNTSGFGPGTDAVLAVRHTRLYADLPGGLIQANEVSTDLYRIYATVNYQFLFNPSAGGPRIYVEDGTATLDYFRIDGVDVPLVSNSHAHFYTPTPGAAQPEGVNEWVYAVPATNVQVTAKARWWPTSDPIAGLPVTIPGTGVGPFEPAGTTPRLFISRAALTDSNGEVTFNTGSAPPGWPSTVDWGGVPNWDSGGRWSCNPNTTWLRYRSVSSSANHADPTPFGTMSGSAYNKVGLPYPNLDAYFELARWDGIATATRTPLKIFEDGTHASLWSGYAHGALPDDASVSTGGGANNATEAAKVTVSQAGAAIKAATASTLSASFVYGLQRAVSDAATQQLLNSYRYLRLRINASAAGTCYVVLYSARGDTANPLRGQVRYPVTLAAGDNTVYADLLGLKHYPWGTATTIYDPTTGANVARTRGYLLDTDPNHALNSAPTWNTALADMYNAPNTSPTPVSPGATYWGANNYDHVRIEGLKASATYLVQEVALLDREDGNRTPIRADGEPSFWGNPSDPTPSGGQNYQSVARGYLSVKANGMPVMALDLGSLRRYDDSIDTLLTRLAQYYDAGAGVWSFSSNDPATAQIPVITVRPDSASASPTGFDLDAVALYPYLDLSPAYDVTVSPTLTLHIDVGGNVDGLLVDNTQAHGVRAGKKVSAYLLDSAADGTSPEPAPALTLTATTDDDGYFRLEGLVGTVEPLTTSALQSRYDGTFYQTSYYIWADDDPPYTAHTATEYSGGVYTTDRERLYFGHRATAPYVNIAKLLALAAGGIAIDPPRQWLHVAVIKAVRTYSAGSGALLFTSPNYSLDAIADLVFDEKHERLVIVGQSGSAYKVLQSADGGLTATEVLSVTASNALLGCDSTRAALLLLLEDGSHNVTFRRSIDAGNTWSTAAATLYNGSQLQATLLDITWDSRRNVFDLVCTIGTNTVVLESADVGAKWALKIS